MSLVHAQTSEYTNENGTSLHVHKVTEDTAGSYDIVGVGNRDIREGELLVVNPNNGNKFDVITDSDLRDNGWSAVDRDVNDVDTSTVDTDGSTVDDDNEDPDDFDPSEHKVSEVKAFLAKHPDQTSRVVADEHNGKNRSGVTNLQPAQADDPYAV
jgi:hypothetical protein